MNIYGIIILDEVHDFLDNLGEYILNQAYDSSISQKFISQIYSKMYALKILPHRCEEFGAGYRVFTINKQYRVIFRVDEENKQIIVVNIFSCSQDYNDIF